MTGILLVLLYSSMLGVVSSPLTFSRFTLQCWPTYGSIRYSNAFLAILYLLLSILISQNTFHVHLLLLFLRINWIIKYYILNAMHCFDIQVITQSFKMVSRVAKFYFIITFPISLLWVPLFPVSIHFSLQLTFSWLL